MTLSAGQIIIDEASFELIIQDIYWTGQCIVERDVEGGAITLLSVLSQRVVQVTIGVTSSHITPLNSPLVMNAHCTAAVPRYAHQCTVGPCWC